MTEEKFIDKYTSIDETLQEIIPLLKRINSGDITVNMPEDGDMAEVIRLLEYDHEKNYKIHFFTFPNDGTRITLLEGKTYLNFEAGTVKDTTGTVTNMSSSLSKLQKDNLRSVACSGDRDFILQLGSSDKIYIRANSWFVGTYQEFTRAIITTTGDTEFSMLCCTNPQAVVEMVGESTVAAGKEEHDQIKSDKDVHFTGAIAQNTHEEENITGLISNEITIEGISIIADEPLSYRLWFFQSDGFQDADFDNDEFIEFVEFDLSAVGKQLDAAGQYYYATTGLTINYDDKDNSGELHVALENLSVAAKTAGAAGEIVLKFAYNPRQ